MNHEEMQAKATVRPVKERIEDELLKIPGVTAVDIAFKELDGRRPTRWPSSCTSVRRSRSEP